MSDRLPVKAAQTTFAIVERLITLDGAGVSKLAEDLDQPKTTIHDHLTTLDRLEFIRRDGHEYNASTKWLYLGERVRENMAIYRTAKPELATLSKNTGELASLMIEENGEGVYLRTAEGPQTVNVVAPAGTRTKLHTTAPGKAILAHLPEDRAREIVERTELTAPTSQTITDETALFEELATIRRQEYAVDQQEGLKGLHGVAAPVFSRTEDVLAGAISVYGPSRQTDIDEFKEDVLDELRRTVNIVEINLSY